MSVSITCQAHLNGGDQQIRVSEIVNQFIPFLKNVTHSGFDIVYDVKNSSHVFIDTDTEFCSSFSINRPCGDERMFEALFNCLQLGNFICYMDGEFFIITDPLTLQHLPEDMKNHVTSEPIRLIVADKFADFRKVI